MRNASKPAPLLDAMGDQNPSMLPPELRVGEHLARVLRRFLASKGLESWAIFSQGHAMLARIFEDRLDDLDEPDAKWEPLPPLVPNGERFNCIGMDENGKPHLRPTGCLILPHWKVAVARWAWISLGDCNATAYYAYAAATVEDFDVWARHVEGLKRPDWVFVGGRYTGCCFPRGAARSWDHLTLPAAVRQRLEDDVGGFFKPPCRELYKRLELPYKRGVLLWGPPGNGKTSIIRTLAAQQPDIAALVLAPGTNFGDDELRDALDTWRDQAPALLVMEDLDTLLGPTKASVSTFLNLLDGIDQRHGRGLMLIATTNHPENLDPAINNRPGRFDVVMEVAKPTRAMRLDYIQRHLPELDAPTQERMARQTEGLSFAHLQDIRLRSGYIALRRGHTDRTPPDVLEAAESLTSSHQTAQGGFQQTTEENFGFALAKTN